MGDSIKGEVTVQITFKDMPIDADNSVISATINDYLKSIGNKPNWTEMVDIKLVGIKFSLSGA